jgi:hypothetical protein
MERIETPFFIPSHLQKHSGEICGLSSGFPSGLKAQIFICLNGPAKVGP